jgi:hypothetical protein
MFFTLRSGNRPLLRLATSHPQIAPASQRSLSLFIISGFLALLFTANQRRYLRDRQLSLLKQFLAP